MGKLLEMSTYHHIRDGTPHPAVLLVHGMNDPRVDVCHSAKTAARLQAADMHGFLLWQMGKMRAVQ